ncbi:hypothetical protein RMSM_05078 [Rhodopirellula maiorica SM1]|uniref:Uncharacterized protein n=1 Tax=Rhodopirellula maiorica SM1 TaxID=1265738 RepID=M5REV2_9BACT|nr:hypothetical protein RMSM_05078 [Rhodopirellula maiorica SM1]
MDKTAKDQHHNEFDSEANGNSIASSGADPYDWEKVGLCHH